MYYQLSTNRNYKMPNNLYKRKQVTIVYSSINSNESNFANKKVLLLKNPLLLRSNQKKIKQYIPIKFLQSNLEHDKPLLDLTLISKPNKKVKKNKKEQIRDNDWNSNKLKVKKKNRLKVNITEDIESVEELLADRASNNGRVTEAIHLTKSTFPFSTHQKQQSKKYVKKAKKLIFNEKDNNEKISKLKPEKIRLTNPLTLLELANLYNVNSSILFKSLFDKRISINPSQRIDLVTAQKLGEEIGINVYLEPEEKRFDNSMKIKISGKKQCIARPPIVIILGHIGHGKTTLLNKIRKTQVAQKEIGHMTQTLDTSEINVTYKEEKRTIVFLDTPGHETFYKMRFRGISISDIAIIVIAADDGIRTQTIEAIEYVTSAKIPLIIAITKIDKNGVNLDTIKKELINYNIISEEWGGNNLIINIIENTTIDKLLEMILMLADKLNFQSEVDIPATGVVLEASLDKTKGVIATLLVQAGILHIGDIIAVNSIYAKIRGILNYSGESIKEAYPSSPITLLGFQKIPSLGGQFITLKNEKEAKIFTKSNLEKDESERTLSIQDNYVLIDSKTKKQINITLKGNTQGIIETVLSGLNKLHGSFAQIKILQASVGEVTETDLEFAKISKSNIITFNINCSTKIKKSAKQKQLNIKEFNIIYDLLEYIQLLLEKGPDLQNQDTYIGFGIVKNIFPLAKSFVAGISIVEGKILKTSFIHIIRNDETIYKGFITSLKKMKENVLEVLEGSDCGISINEFNSWKLGDIVKIFEVKEKLHTL